MGKVYDFDESIDRSGTNSVKLDYRKEYFGTDDLVPMWVADMDFKTPDFIFSAIKKRADHEILGYSLKPVSFYSSIQDWIMESYSWKVERANISFSPGVVPALNMMVLAFTKPGDKIIVQPPVYFPFFSAVKAHNRVLVYNQLIEENGDYSIDIEGLKKKIDNKTRMLLLCHPHNPVGRVWREQELLELAEVCLDRNILMVSDEVHSDLVFPHQKHTPLATISKEVSDNTITCMAPSKTFNTAGMATSYLIIENPQLLKRYNEILDNLHIGMGNIFGTVALEAAYRYGRPWLNQMLDYVWGNVLFVESFLKDRIPAIRMVKPEATYLLWLDCRHLKLKGKALTEFMISKVGLGLNDGASFGPGGEGFQRMNVACPRSQVETALERLEAAVKKLKI